MYRVGSPVDALGADEGGPQLLVEDTLVDAGTAYVWQVSTDGPSGAVAGASVGRLSRVGNARYWTDLNGDGGAELVGTADTEPQALLALAVSGPELRGPADAWLRATYHELHRSTPQLRAAAPCGDLDGDGTADLCRQYEDDVRVWFAPLDPSTFSADVPDLRASVAPHQVVTSAFGLRPPAGGPSTLVVGWKELPSDVSWLTVPGPDGTLADGTTTSGPAALVAVGDLAPAPGDEVFLRSGRTLLDDVFLYALSEGGLVPTGATIETRSDVLGRGTAGAGAAGDFDGDGVDDLALAALDAVFVFRGPFGPDTLTLDDADLRLTSGAPGDGFGESVAAADLDGDGVDDLVVGAPLDDGLAPDGGAVHVWRGADLVPSGASSGTRRSR